jgi:hypothetical protein
VGVLDRRQPCSYARVQPFFNVRRLRLWRATA